MWNANPVETPTIAPAKMAASKVLILFQASLKMMVFKLSGKNVIKIDTVITCTEDKIANLIFNFFQARINKGTLNVKLKTPAMLVSEIVSVANNRPKIKAIPETPPANNL